MEHIYVSPSGDGHRNLATDEFILEKYRRGEMTGVTLYFYVNSNAVIIGRNQNAWRECALERMKAEGVQLVRRHTGGGAVYHDCGNLNFSFITDEKHYDRARFTGLIIAAMRSLGVEAEANGRNDLTVDGFKFSGCAYALRGVARGMHGTLLVSADMEKLSRYLVPSQKKLAAKGITSVRSRVKNLSELKPLDTETVMQAVINAFKAEFGECAPLSFTPEEEDAIARQTERQASWEWLLGETPVFDYKVEERFSFGELQLLLKVKKGYITSAKTYTDSLDESLPERLEKALVGVRFGTSELIEALMSGGAEEGEIAKYLLERRENTMDDKTEKLIEGARRSLHEMPELSGEERSTQAFIKEFLKEHTSLRTVDRGAWLYAAHDEGAEKTVVVRADHDAVPVSTGAKHLCGHDGHTAALLGLALLIEAKKLGKNVILLFQHAEENGAGAAECCEIFSDERLTRVNARVIGCHNIPGEPMGMALLREGTFACASCGADITLKGSPTHAAYPENGTNPTAAAARLALEIPDIAAGIGKKYGCMALATIVGMRTGERAFGVAASDASLWVTLRAEKAEAFEELNARVDESVKKYASDERLNYSVERLDVFPSTENDPVLLEDVETALKESGAAYKYLAEPFRWSEDFGHYGAFAPACFFGVGSGEDTAPLHTEAYEYPDRLATVTAELLLNIIKGV